MIKAIEQGIITDATKGRLTELEAEINHLDFEIAKEKAHNYAFLTVEQIESYLSHFVFDNTDNVKVRKLIINTFVREVILYEDEIVITYNFTDSPERLKVNKEQILQEEKQIKRAKHSFSFNSGSTILAGSPPKISQSYAMGWRDFFYKGIQRNYSNCAHGVCRVNPCGLTLALLRKRPGPFLRIPLSTPVKT